MLGLVPRPLVAAVVLSSGATSAWAQVDYRNLDEGRPTRVIDASPIERYGFELSIPYSIAWEDRTGRSRLAPHLDYGIGRNLMIGAGLDLSLGGQGNDPTAGRLSVLWNPRRETPSAPAFAFTVEASGARLGDPNLMIGVALTRSIGRSRVHFNGGAAAVRPERLSDRTEPQWWTGLGWDWTLIRSSTLLVADLTVARSGRSEPSEVAIGAGLRRQLTPTVVLHGGLAAGLTAAAEGLRLTFGLSRAFAVAGLMRGGGR